MSDFAEGGYIAREDGDDYSVPVFPRDCGYIITADQARRIGRPMLDAFIAELNKRAEGDA